MSASQSAVHVEGTDAHDAVVHAGCAGHPRCG